MALVIGMVTGAYTIPFRLPLTKEMLEPDYAAEHGCCDADCHQDGCMGNRLELVTRTPAEDDEEWLFDWRDTDIKVHVMHGKNERRMVRELFNVVVTMPRNDHTKLLLAYIRGCRPLMTLEDPDPCPNLFVSDAGNTFSDATFVHYWAKCMKTAQEFGIQYFPPSKARNIFIEEYTEVHRCGIYMYRAS